MSFLAESAAFVLGAVVLVPLVGALYRILDVWYCIREQLGRVSLGIGRSLLLVLLAAWITPPAYRSNFWWGGASFLLLHVLGFEAIQLGLLLGLRRRGRT